MKYEVGDTVKITQEGYNTTGVGSVGKVIEVHGETHVQVHFTKIITPYKEDVTSQYPDNICYIYVGYLSPTSKLDKVLE